MCITMFKKGPIMDNKYVRSPSPPRTALELATAIERFVATGGVIAVIPEGETAGSSNPTPTDNTSALELTGKVELLKCLVAKGAGVNALQYSLRMTKKDVRQLATEHKVRIHFSQPVRSLRREARNDTADVDDVVAGHAMHYSALGYAASEIAQLLDLSVRQIWNIGKAYRYEFRQQRESDTPKQPDSAPGTADPHTQ
ncbi:MULTISPECIES: hypothetical protein [Pseudomonas syringae group]|uniref:Uncharacterized protein n=4 Tax=Pseudomonas syringae group TaxID=136849 RepID=A0AAE6QL36_9PSED|nr:MULTISPECIES: hypothetical protein [Pseudomonas syringae group]MCF5802183.1 hypothetical protein [Pseudomonas tremae]MCF5807095.1 hypothetical protein [Pseudomonas tremae]QGL59559.1 hypothetical protein POR16_05875 [Pseudomonas coronafaciens pv. oryzae str. 1_6]QGT84579.1 hypothetical protein GMO17_05935 [Pseudomonas coronafaciens pv. coronafaciens]